MNFDYEKIIKIIDNVIIECSFFVNQWSKDLIKLKEDGFRNIFAISLNMRLNRNGEQHEYSIDNEALSRGGKTDISIKNFNNYRFQYIIEVKIYSSNEDINRAFYQISQYINPYMRHASVIMINKCKQTSDFVKIKKKIKKYFDKNKKIDIVNQNETKYESIKLELVYHLNENVEYNIFFYYVDFYSKQMNKSHITDKTFFKEQKIITQSEFESIKKYILGQIKTNSIPLDSVTQKDKYLHKIYKNQEKSLKHTEKTISEISNLNPDEEKDIKEFLNKQKEIKEKDKKNLTIFEANLEDYLKILYIIKDDNKKNKKS